MKTVEELKTRMKELSKQAVELRRKGSEVYEINPEQAKHFRQQAREAMKRCQVLIQELKRQQV
jgi:predicted nuclease with RNAse H fold